MKRKSRKWIVPAGLVSVALGLGVWQASRIGEPDSDGLTPTTGEETNPNVLGISPYFARALDGSLVFVRENGTGTSDFYRDRDNDGWADSKGELIYWVFGDVKIVSEHDLPSQKYRMEEFNHEAYRSFSRQE